MTAGVPASFSVQSNDEYGNERNKGESTFASFLNPRSSIVNGGRSSAGEISDAGDGTYSVEYLSHSAGVADLHVYAYKGIAALLLIMLLL